MRRSLTSVISLFAVAMTVGLGAHAGADGARASAMEQVTALSLPGATHLEFFTRTIDGVERTFGMAGSRSALFADVANNVGGGGLNIIELSDLEAPDLIANIPCRNTGGAVDSAYVPLSTPRTVTDVSFGTVTYDAFIVIASNDGAPANCKISYPVGGVTRKGGGMSFIGVRQTPRAGERVSFDWFGNNAVSFATGLPVGVAWFNNGPAVHTVVASPTAPVVYGANQNLGDRTPTVEVADLSQFPPVVRQVALPATGVGPHDITFSPDGTRAYASSINATFIWDTTDPLNPVTLTTITSPNLKIHHEAVLHPDGRHLIVVDEFVAASGAGNNPQCPGGGLHIFDMGPDRTLELAPVLVGQFYANDLSTPGLDITTPTEPKPDLEVACTAHEYSISPDGTWMPIAWMGAGARALDLSQLVTAATLPVPTPVVITELGYYVESHTDVWAAKVHRNLPGFIFVTDTSGYFRVLRRTP